jgi:hypothetical protein
MPDPFGLLSLDRLYVINLLFASKIEKGGALATYFHQFK